MPTLEEQIEKIEEEIQKTPYNKASQHHIGKLKAKIAKLKENQIKRSQKGQKGTGFSVKKEGDATIALVGFPSVGKSTLLNKLTNADSKVASFDFTTLSVIPGIMLYSGAKIQILDIPGLISGASYGRGKGREILSVARSSDILILILDAHKLEHLKVIEQELTDSGLRLNKKKPNVRIKKTYKGGVVIFSSLKDIGITISEIKGVLNQYNLYSAEVTIREKITIDDFIDVVLGNRVYIPTVVCVNKIDSLTEKERNDLKKKYHDFIFISAEYEKNLDELRRVAFSKLDLMRIYMKPQGEEVDMNEPLILKKDSTIRDLCKKLHKEFLKKFRYARVTGKSVKFPDKKAGLNHVLCDKDIVTIVKSR